MPKLSSVTVVYGRKVQPAPYESADAQVSLTLALDPDETVSTDEQIAAAMQTAVRHVSETLGLKVAAKPATKTSKPAVKANLDVGGPEEAPAPAAPVQEQKPVEAPVEAPTAPVQEQEQKPISKQDINAAVAGAIARFDKAGAKDGPARVKQVIASYLPDGQPPFVYSRVPQHAWGDLFKDINDLGRA
jgi:hypothetical protein